MARDGRGTGAGSDRRNARAARAIKHFLQETRDVTAVVRVHLIGPARNAAAIARAVGFRVTGFSIVLENNAARHTLHRHGNARREQTRGQLAVTEDDLATTPQLLCEFDAVDLAAPTKQGTPQIRLQKRIGSVTYEVFAEVRRSAKQIAFKTMIKRSAKESSSP